MGTLKLYRTGVGWEVIGTAPRGIPPGGAANALLAKATAVDGETAWTTAPIVSSISVTGSVLFSDGANIACGTATGSKIGTSSTQKLGFWGAAPVAQSTGWAITPGYAAGKTLDPQTATLSFVARVLGTLIDTLKANGLLG